jgi:hypothetical protein
MDPLDKEKPWGIFGQLVLIALAIGVIYLIIRLAVVVPEYGWQIILVISLIAPVLYYFLAFRKPRKPRALPPRLTAARRAAQAATAVLLAVALSLPVFVSLYYLRTGTLPWL